MCWSSGSAARHRPRGGAKLFHFLLHCMGLVVAHRVDSLRCEGLDAIGARRTCRERRKQVDRRK
jgi:hypothetical protein